MSDIEVSQSISSDPLSVYELVSDLPRMGQWSPENTGGKWLDGATGPSVGAKFKGSNKAGFRRWSTTCTVTAASPGERFSFDVHSGPVAISTWDYTFTPTSSGCQVVEAWTDKRPAWMRLVAVPVTGVSDRSGHNRNGMQATLDAVKRAAEGST